MSEAVPLQPPRVRIGVRIVAFLLMAGGLMGCLSNLQPVGSAILGHDYAGALTAMISVVVFGYCAAKGICLWRGPGGVCTACTLFALQVPVLGVMGYVYEFTTCASLSLVLSDHSLTFGGNLGSSLVLPISPRGNPSVVGLNFLALAVTLYLWRVMRVNRRQQEIAVPIDKPAGAV